MAELLDEDLLILAEHPRALRRDQANRGPANLGRVVDELVGQDALADVTLQRREEPREGRARAVRREGLEVLAGFKGDEFPAHAGRDVLVGRTGPELRSHVALDVAARLLDDAGHVGVVLDRQLLEFEDVHLVLDGVDGVLEQRHPTGAGSVLVVDDVHHRLRQDLAVRAVRAVDVKGNQFPVSTEDAAVMHTLGGRHVHRVAHAVGLDELKFRVAVGVPHLGREGVAVPGHRPHED